ncbi:MAG: short chain dehydrogenase [Porticoccaceae bacterium]|nr:short chain dehydrogenase [Porticoccaceae bacterium]
MDFDNKRILLTGATGGIGIAIAKQLAARGAYLTLVGRDQGKLQRLADDLITDTESGKSHSPVIVPADINTQAGRARVAAASELHGIDALINTAGVQAFGLFENQTETQISDVINVNLTATILLTQTLLPLLYRSAQATIVNIGSTFGSIGHPGFVAYCASKFGLRGFTEALRRELSDSDICVHYLAPRATRTTMNSDRVNLMNDALGNAMDDPDEVARAVIAVLQKPHGQRRFLGWPEKLLVKINGLFPGIVDRALGKQLPTIRQFACMDK